MQQIQFIRHNQVVFDGINILNLTFPGVIKHSLHDQRVHIVHRPKDPFFLPAVQLLLLSDCIQDSRIRRELGKNLELPFRVKPVLDYAAAEPVL